MNLPYLTSVVGSFPDPSAGPLVERLIETLDIPCWPQLPRRSFRESMYVQYAAPMPNLIVDDDQEKVYFDTNIDLTPGLERFYQSYLEGNPDDFQLAPQFAEGFYALLETLGKKPAGPEAWVKGQVTGPISFGLTVTDQDLRASLYNDLLADVIVKNMAMNARWQIRQLKAVRPNVILFVDEPYMASYGSAFISLSREQATAMLDEVFTAIHEEGGLAGVHCCANTDWSVLLGTQVDILNLDAYGFVENLALYPGELRNFLDRNGAIAWGLVPNNETIEQETPESLAARLRGGLVEISKKAAARGVRIDPEEFKGRSLILPSCGLGSTTPDIAGRVLDVLAETGKLIQGQ